MTVSFEQADIAQAFGDAHERKAGALRKKGRLVMDLHNNSVGRYLAVAHGGEARIEDGVRLVSEALETGMLMSTPPRFSGDQ